MTAGAVSNNYLANNRINCENLPNLFSSFVDTFVDYTVSGGLFLPTLDIKSSQNDPEIITRYPPADRLIAIGDLHGDLDKSKEALRLAGLIDSSDQWIGSSTTVVQIGDVLDRGNSELKILYLLEKLKREATRSGGKLITMQGNHEIMNIDGDYRYVTRLGLKEFEDWAEWFSVGNRMKSLCVGLEEPRDIFDGIPSAFNNVKKEYHNGIRARIAAFRPDGPIARRFLSQNPTVLVVGDSVFVHGGLLQQHVEEYGLDKINQEVRDWINGLMGRNAKSPKFCRGRNAVVWSRKFSDEPKNCDCRALEHVLATIPGVKRMIMGHTIQVAGINSVCDDRAIRIDVGMSKGCGNGLPEVLEINRKSEIRILTSNPLYHNKNKAHNYADTKEGLGLLVPEPRPKQVEVKA